MSLFSMNKVILVGNVGQMPEYKTLSSGNRLCSFSLATTESYRNSMGDYEDKTEWHRISIFGKLVDTCEKMMLGKGHKLMIEGKLQHRKYQDNDGKDRYVTDVVISGFNSSIVFLDRKGQSAGQGGSVGGHEGSSMGAGQRGSVGGYEGSSMGSEQGGHGRRDESDGGSDLNDEVPF